MKRRVASCACGRLQVMCEGEPARVSMCHCLECQRRTGSLFGVTAFFDRAGVNVSKGSARRFTRNSASGKTVTFHFCENCGTSLFWEPERLPHLIGVAVGAFADPDFPCPAQAVWTASRHGWLDLPAAMPAFEGPLVPASGNRS